MKEYEIRYRRYNDFEEYDEDMDEYLTHTALIDDYSVDTDRPDGFDINLPEYEELEVADMYTYDGGYRIEIHIRYSDYVDLGYIDIYRHRKGGVR